MSVEYTAIVRKLSSEKFAEVLAASSRQARQTYFHRHHVKPKKQSKGFTKPGAKNEAKAHALFDVLQDVDDEELCEEVLRNYLLDKRAMLIAALDHLEIEHEDGLTESEDLEKFTELSGKETKALAKKLMAHGDAIDVAMYLEFMGAQDVAKAVA